MASSILADYRLTPKEWTEIKDCTDALFAVVGIFKEMPNRAEVGGIETLESVQRRLSLTVTSAANRLNGDDWECPLCGNTTPPPEQSNTPPDSGDDQCTLCGNPKPDRAEETPSTVQ